VVTKTNKLRNKSTENGKHAMSFQFKSDELVDDGVPYEMENGCGL
jgi:hypothetical protein